MVRILFVDDEQRVLDGLKRTLRTMRAEWEMEFVGSGPAALEVLANNPYDVIVTDMRMPEMDGPMLLTEVFSSYPELMRVALSGQSEMEAKVCDSGLVHLYLSKPCPVAKLTSTLQDLIREREKASGA